MSPDMEKMDRNARSKGGHQSFFTPKYHWSAQEQVIPHVVLQIQLHTVHFSQLSAFKVLL